MNIIIYCVMYLILVSCKSLDICVREFKPNLVSVYATIANKLLSILVLFISEEPVDPLSLQMLFSPPALNNGCDSLLS